MTVDPPLDDRDHDAPSPTAGTESSDSVNESSPPLETPAWSFDSRSPDLGWSAVSPQDEPATEPEASSSNETDQGLQSTVAVRDEPTVAANTIDEHDGSSCVDGDDGDRPNRSVEEMAVKTTAFVLPGTSPPSNDDADRPTADHALLGRTLSAEDSPLTGTSKRLHLGRRTPSDTPSPDDRSGPMLESFSAFKTPTLSDQPEPSWWETVVEVGEDRIISLYRRQAFVAGLALLALVFLAAFSLPQAFERDPGPGLLKMTPNDSTVPRSPAAVSNNVPFQNPLLPTTAEEPTESSPPDEPEPTAAPSARNRSNRVAATPATEAQTSSSSTISTTSEPLAPSPSPSTASTVASPPTSDPTVDYSSTTGSSISVPGLSTAPPASVPVVTSTPSTTAPPTQPPTTRAPTTRPPTTAPPTQPPTTRAPTTRPPTTAPPTTRAPTTKAPASNAPKAKAGSSKK